MASSRSIGGPPTGAPIGSIRPARAATNSRTRKARCRSRPANSPRPRRRFVSASATCRCCLAGMAGSNRGWVEAPYVPCPAASTNWSDNLVWADERAAIVPGPVRLGRRTRRRHARRGGPVARRRRGRQACRPTRWSAIPGTHNKWVRGRAGPDRAFPHGHDRRAVQPVEAAQHPRRPARRARSRANEAFGDGVAHALATTMLPAELFSIRARVGCSARRA